ncbi:uncharacterized protein DNG_02783 [Cephalotrichum gorgonifer]|uniref:Uncharacterized protein n=1 Tax=Cephalotrichum gorgonifer TaxID=2041049 RepID=A0AAE8MVB5_9PEZI|nr:uncharacterized protein DNG_02783 [Cephalotrichum gorgonifer]
MAPRWGSSISRGSSSPQNRVMKPPHTRSTKSLQDRRSTGQVVVDGSSAMPKTPTPILETPMLDRDSSGIESGPGSGPPKRALPSSRLHPSGGSIPIDADEEWRYREGAKLYRDHFFGSTRNRSQTHRRSAIASIELNEPPQYFDIDASQGAGEMTPNTTTISTRTPEVAYPHPRLPRPPHDQAATTRVGPALDDGIIPDRPRPALGSRYVDSSRGTMSRGQGEGTTRDLGTVATYSYPRPEKSGWPPPGKAPKDSMEDMNMVRRNLEEMEEKLRAATKRRIREVSASLDASPTKERPEERLEQEAITSSAN